MTTTESAAGIEQVVPFQVPGVDPSSCQLSPSEAFLYTRVDGSTSIGQLFKLSGLGATETLTLLKSLRHKGIIDWEGADAEGPELDRAALAEENDLDLKTKERILTLYARLDELNHYQLLGLPRDADAKQIKKAYFEASRLYHPDTYFRKNLGSFKARIDAIFKRISQAYDILSNPQRRAAYDASLPAEVTPEQIESERQSRQHGERLQSLRAERRRRMLRNNPLARRRAQARHHLQQARAAEQKGDVIGAANAAKLALALLPDDREVADYHAHIETKAAPERARIAYKRGLGDESLGRLEEALEWFQRAVENNPEDARALLKAATLMLELKRQLRQAVQYCRKVLAIEPDNHRARLTLGMIFLEQGLLKNAVRELGLYVEANPLDERTAEKLKQLKKQL